MAVLYRLLMNILSDIAFHPRIPGDLLLRPLRYFVERSCRSVALVALGILFSPLIVASAIAGATVKAGALLYGYNPAKRIFGICKISADTFPEVAKTALAWNQLAIVKQQSASAVDTDMFFSSITITQLIADCFTYAKDCIPRVYEKAIACYDIDDPTNAFHAIALIKDDRRSLFYLDRDKRYLKIAHIATHPINIRSVVNRYEYDRVEGASSALIQHLAKVCLKKGYAGIYLEATPSALGFYKKFGFEVLEKSIVVMTERSAVPMRLTAARISKLSTIS